MDNDWKKKSAQTQGQTSSQVFLFDLMDNDWKKKSALDVQVGGSHYKGFKIQPVEFITKNKLSFLQGCIIKRICRFNQCGGSGLKDLEKIKHEVDLLIEIEGWK